MADQSHLALLQALAPGGVEIAFSTPKSFPKSSK